MLKKTYLLTIQFEFQATDDIGAESEVDKMREQYKHAPNVSYRLTDPGPPPHTKSRCVGTWGLHD